MGVFDFISKVPIVGDLLGGDQAEMAQQAAAASQKSWSDYLNLLNPPESVKKTRFQGLKGQVLGSVPGMRQNISSQLASRGIRGQGAAAPIAAGEQNINDLINQAYFNVYSQHNVPSGPGPSGWAPSAGQMVGSNLGDIGMNLGSMWLGSKMFPGLFGGGGGGGGGGTSSPYGRNLGYGSGGYGW